MKNNQEKHLRKCPKCNKEINYSTKYTKAFAEKNNSKCKKCSTKENSNKPEFKKKASERIKGKNNPMHGKTKEKNHFYGKKHSTASLEKMKQSQKKTWDKIKSNPEKLKEIKEKQRQKSLGKNNPMYGKNFYEIWVEKYGKENADKKLKQLKEKQSKNSSGKNNPMYGKPSPQSSGNGWKGWYKGTFFRSLRELMFLINYIERFKMNYESLEQKKYKIPYTDPYGQKRNYFGDYIINNKYFIEIKPKKLQNSPLNKCKKEAALEYCKNNNLIYKEIDPRINNKIIKENHKNGNIKFQKKYETQYQEKFKETI